MMKPNGDPFPARLGWSVGSVELVNTETSQIEAQWNAAEGPTALNPDNRVAVMGLSKHLEPGRYSISIAFENRRMGLTHTEGTFFQVENTQPEVFHDPETGGLIKVRVAPIADGNVAVACEADSGLQRARVGPSTKQRVNSQP